MCRADDFVLLICGNEAESLDCDLFALSNLGSWRSLKSNSVMTKGTLLSWPRSLMPHTALLPDELALNVSTEVVISCGHFRFKFIRECHIHSLLLPLRIPLERQLDFLRFSSSLPILLVSLVWSAAAGRSVAPTDRLCFANMRAVIRAGTSVTHRKLARDRVRVINLVN